MQTVGVLAHVNRAYEQSEAFQWAREATVNSIQAGATEIKFGVAWQAVKTDGVYRRTIADNGRGMTAQMMPAFLNKFGGSGQTIGAIVGNYGIGLKTSVLPWNPAGVVVISVTTQDSYRSVNMMWLQRFKTDAGDFDYGARALVTEMMDDDDAFDWGKTFTNSEEAMTVLPLDRMDELGYDMVFEGLDWLKAVPDFIMAAGHGTFIMLLGNKRNDHSFDGDTARNEHVNKYGLSTYLNSRFYSLPANVKITVLSLGSAEPNGKWTERKNWPKESGECGITWRPIYGMKSVLERYADRLKAYGETCVGESEVTLGHAEVPATIITHLFPPMPPEKRTHNHEWMANSGDQIAVPIYAVLHEAHDGIVEAFSVSTGLAEGKSALHKWVQVDSVKRRMAILVIPRSTETEQVFPDGTRRKMLYQNAVKGGSDMPTEEWANHYRDGLKPDFVRRAIDDFFREAAEGTVEISDELIKKLASQYHPFMVHRTERRASKKRQRIIEPSDATDEAPPVGGGGKRIPGGVPKHGGRQFDVPVGLMPAVADSNDDDPAYPLSVSYDQSIPKVIVRTNHVLIKDAWECSKLRLVSDGLTDDQLEKCYMEFQKQTLCHASLAITHLMQYARSFPGKRTEITDDKSLVSVMAGIRPLLQASQGSFGSIKAGRVTST